MCIFGGGSSAPVKDLEAEAAQKAQKEQEQKEKALLKKQQTEASVVRSAPLVSTTPPPETQAFKPEEDSEMIKSRKLITVFENFNRLGCQCT